MLEIRDLRAGYGQSMVLNGVNLDIAHGTVTALLGRNGMGKTTLCRVLIGLLPMTSGTITLDNDSISHMAPHRLARRGLAYVPQGRSIFARFTVQENLDLGLSARGGRIPPHIFEWFPMLAELRGRRAGTLSGGEQQMLALARALVAEPSLLILDEPSEGLQPSRVTAIGDVLLRIVADKRVTVFLVEQNLALVRRVAAITAFLVDGVIAGGAAGRDLSPQSPLIQRYLGL